jgi:DNA modification methylase
MSLLYRVIQGDALSVLRTLPAESAHCCVTSPPYWGLRDYGTERQIWGGAEGHRHRFEESVVPAANGIVNPRGMTGETLSGCSATRKPRLCETCECGAWRGELGLEPTPELYVANLVSVFGEVRRVLRDDGTLWIVIGDSYATGAGKVGEHPGGGKQGARYRGTGRRPGHAHAPGFGYRGMHAGDAKSAGIGPRIQPNRMPIPGLKAKDIVGIPWRLAFALQAAGWFLRCDMIWEKPNAFPSSVRDRPTRSHEYIFLLSKSRKYYYDREAVLEPHGFNRRGGARNMDCSVLAGAMDGHAGKSSLLRKGNQNFFPGNGRNKRSVWTVNTKPSGVAHFASYPPELIEPCIRAGCPRGGDVFDPFSGIGTTGIVARANGRNYLGIELNPEYVAMSYARGVAADLLERAGIPVLRKTA